VAKQGQIMVLAVIYGWCDAASRLGDDSRRVRQVRHRRGGFVNGGVVLWWVDTGLSWARLEMPWIEHGGGKGPEKWIDQSMGWRAHGHGGGGGAATSTAEDRGAGAGDADGHEVTMAAYGSSLYWWFQFWFWFGFVGNLGTGLIMVLVSTGMEVMRWLIEMEIWRVGLWLID
jgi:hypothetical protein